LLPSEEEIEKRANKNSDNYLDDPHAISVEAFIQGANVVINKIKP
jgi:hypothetical protein